MNDIDECFRYLRGNLRKQGKIIAEDVFKRIHPTTPKDIEEICVFCKATSDLTREHVLPQWLFESNINLSMISSVNKQTQKYHKAVIPTCSKCNNITLSTVEKNIINILKKIDSKIANTQDDLSNIIRWLEILDYKLQVYDSRRKFIKYGNSEYDPVFGEFSVAMLSHFYEMNPFKAYSFLRQSQNRITRMKKHENLNSLLIFDTKKPNFYFFSLPNEHIFISFPMFKIAIFYFFRKKYTIYKEAIIDACDIIANVIKE